MEQTKVQYSCAVGRRVPSPGRAVGDANSSTTHISANGEYVRYSGTTQDHKLPSHRGRMSRLLHTRARLMKATPKPSWPIVYDLICRYGAAQNILHSIGPLVVVCFLGQ